MFSPDFFPDPAVAEPDILYATGFLSPVEDRELREWCLAHVDWKIMTMSFGGASVPMPRRIGWFGDVDYAYSGVRHAPNPMPAPLRQLADRIETWVALQGHPARFNSLLLNHYRDGNDSIGMHADDETQLGPQPTIASISLGAACTFTLQHIASGQRRHEQLPGGSLLVMKGAMQRHWRHGIPKEPGRGPRVNLTYRFTHSAAPRK